MILRTLLFVTALILFSATGHTAETTEFWRFSSGDWTGGAYKDMSGSFSHCYASASYVSGIAMAIGITADYDIQIALGHSKWNLPVGEAYNVGLAIDGRHLGQFSAIAREKSFLVIYIGDRNDVFTRLRLGHRLRVTAAQETLYFGLTGTNRALKKVKECVDLAVALSPSKRNPFASANAQANPFAPDANSESEKERGIVEALLVAAGLEEPAFLDPGLVGLEGASYAWTSGGVVGAMFVVDASESGVDDLSRKVLGDVAADCEGKFGFESEASLLIDGSRLKQFSAACRSIIEGDSFFAATAVESAGSVLFILNFTTEEPSTVRRVNGLLYTVLGVLLKQ